MDKGLPEHAGLIAWCILALPLVSFLVGGLWLGRRCWRTTGILAVILNGIGAVLAGALAVGLMPYPTWFVAGPEWLRIASGLAISFDLSLDRLAVMMLVVVSSISTLVHLYSLGYMRGDPGAGRFFPLLSFFTFAMMGLVTAANLVQLYIFWELVGVASYLLIGFWYERPSAVAAAKKAFVVTRFADAFFLVGIILLGAATGGFGIAQANAPAAAEALRNGVLAEGVSVNLLAVAGILIFAGGWGKSAMFPLHVWLPDAMEGPTPVSSIIHSATMVVAGVFLTARMFPLFAASGVTLALVECVGAFTALFAAVIACTQTDIKRILAYSTLSQLGYMMFSLGAANATGYTASVFHIFTHAFFKAMLFLAAGALIHAVHDNDLARMGGLRRRMPWTFAAALVGCLAIAGFWPFSGFFSKDLILLASWQAGHTAVFVVGLAASLLTAFYMFRFFFLAFTGAARGDTSHARDDGVMTIPIVALAIPSAAVGWLAKDFFEVQFAAPLLDHGGHAPHAAWLPYVVGALGVVGLLGAFLRYGRGVTAEQFSRDGGPLYRVVRNKFYVDELYLWLTKRVAFNAVARPSDWIDRRLVDGSMNAVAWVMQWFSAIQRMLQNGQVQFYLAMMVIGLVCLWIAGGLW
jgi:NADH-quinone oxidoreductase subunit L